MLGAALEARSKSHRRVGSGGEPGHVRRTSDSANLESLTFEKEQVTETPKPTSALAGLLSGRKSKTSEDLDTMEKDSMGGMDSFASPPTVDGLSDLRPDSVVAFCAEVFFPCLKSVRVHVSQPCSIRLFVECVVKECVTDLSCLENVAIFLMAASADGEVDEDLPVLDERRTVTGFGLHHFTLTAVANKNKQASDSDTEILKFNSVRPCKTDVYIGANHSTRQLSPRACLFRAAEEGRLDDVHLVLNNDSVDVGATGIDNWNALHFAARQGHLPIVNFLLKKDSDIDAVTKNGWSALHLASYQGHYSVAEILLTCGASQLLKDSQGHTALDYATQKKKYGLGGAA